MIDFSKYKDKELISLISDENEIRNAVFTELYSRYAERLKLYCRYKTKTIEDSMELFQETWIKFYQFLTKEPKFVKLPAYLYVIANNIHLNQLRRKKRNVIIDKISSFYHDFMDSFNLQSKIESEDLMNHLNLAIEQLDDKYQEVFILKWISALEYKEIADIQNENIECIRKRCQSSLTQVLSILQPIIIEISNKSENN